MRILREYLGLIFTIAVMRDYSTRTRPRKSGTKRGPCPATVLLFVSIEEAALSLRCPSHVDGSCFDVHGGVELLQVSWSGQRPETDRISRSRGFFLMTAAEAAQ